MRIILIITIFFSIFTQNVLANSGYLEPCSLYPYSMFYFPSTSKLYIGCAGDENSLEICVIDPFSDMTGNTYLENVYLMDGLIESIHPINGGNSLLVLLSDVDGNANTEDGELRKISYQGLAENYFNFDTIPLALDVNADETFAYVTSGLDSNEIVPIISKINLISWQKELNDISYGSYSSDCSLDTSGSKLYVVNRRVFTSETSNYYYEMGVFNTSSMAQYPSIQFNSNPSFIKMGYDNRLYASHSTPEDNQANLSIIDTLTDDYVDIKLGSSGLEDLSIDHINCKLYCTSLTLQLDPELNEEVFMPSNMIYEIDLNNNYCFNIIEIAPEPVIEIEAVPLSDPDYSCRLFAMSESGSKIYYYDIDR